MFYCCLPSENPGRCFRPRLFVICTGVTLFALVLHLNCTALSQSESSNFFMYIIIVIILASFLPKNSVELLSNSLSLCLYQTMSTESNRFVFYLFFSLK